jgi:hypothetical protein
MQFSVASYKRNLLHYICALQNTGFPIGQVFKLGNVRFSVLHLHIYIYM